MSKSDEPTDDSENSIETTEAEPYKDEQLLYDLYVRKDLSQSEIADHFDISQNTVSYWIRKYDIEKPQKTFYRNIQINEAEDKKSGRIYLQPTEGKEPSLSISQITALEDFQWERIWDETNVVHHLMNCKWPVDLAENLAVWKRSTHTKRHAEGTAKDDPETVLQHTFNEFELGFGDSDDDTDQDDALTWKLDEGPPNHCLNPSIEGYDG